MLLSRIGKYCRNFYLSNQSFLRWTALTYRKKIPILSYVKPISRKLIISGIFIVPVIATQTMQYTQNKVDTITHLNNPMTKVHEKSSIMCDLLQYIYEPLSIFLRMIKLILMYTPVAILYPMTYAGDTLTSMWWDLLLFTIERSGPVFVKMGQWSSTRRDIFPENACKNFSKLQRQAKTHSWHNTEYCLAEAFGENWREVFIFEESQKPVGSGCVAQVYKAYMKPNTLQDKKLLPEQMQKSDGRTIRNALSILTGNGYIPVSETPPRLKEEIKDPNNNETTKRAARSMSFTESANLVPVAIKVLHPGIEKRFEQDIAILRGLARCASTMCPPLKWLSLQSCVNEFEKIMLAQLNLEIEADNLETFANNFVKVPAIRFPRPIRPFVTEKVLVETFEEGKSMDQFLKKDEDKQLRRKAAKIGVDALLKMIFQDNFVHADLHPGNIIVQNVDDPVTWGFGRPSNNLRLCILDCGVSSALGSEDLLNFEALFKEVVFGNGTSVGELFLSKSEHLCSDPDMFKSEMTKLVTEARDGAISLDKVDVGHLLQKVSFLLMKHRIRLESAFSSIVLAVFVLEGLGRSLDKDIDILHRAQPFLKI